MIFQAMVDAIPVEGLFATFAVAALAVAEVGYRIGRDWQKHKNEEKEGPTSMIVGSLLALMAFLLAVTMSMASERFDARRALVLEEANAVGTAYLRAGFLAEPAADETRALLREYVPLRIATNDLEEVRRHIVRSEELHARLWDAAEEQARAHPGSDVLALYIEALNEVIDVHEKRIAAGIYARVPATILLLLLFGSMLTLAMVGYNAGLRRRRSPLTAIALIVVLGAVITLVFDLDRPRDGFLEVSQQPLLDLQRNLEGPPGAPPR